MLVTCRCTQVSGLRYVFDPTQPVGRRILAAKLGDGRKLLRDYFGEVGLTGIEGLSNPIALLRVCSCWRMPILER